ncbi:YeiH family protein [Marixanthomonas spongiae]|uniref:Putative sulfate exporter family transporter n=1 Tax=Marixanthomonas spongiae TaxID=2174845 RepID=A0A2U0HWT2_9FLAO|nr:putative sulfate exporter family transporter [Marixanthomonas spongiae]PVW13190.1 putative sulfate exporter family transporter [Marixanthomonas spongiae]
MLPKNNKYSNSKPILAKVLFAVLCLLCLTPFITPPIALLMGVVMAQITGNPFEKLSGKAVSWLLKFAVIGLGFGMSVSSALKAGKDGFVLTVASIAITLTLGILLGKLFKIDKKIAQLISSGTAICGGSAIAAIAPVIKANAKQISISIGIVFLLNALALFIFPVLGHFFELTQHQFGVWSAIAIHDTSSVVGAANEYGNEALQTATTVKLARALWILPVSVLFAVYKSGSVKKVKVPYFIGLFIVAIIVNTYVPGIESVAPHIVSLAKIALTVTLFLIGTNLTYASLKQVGIKPLALAVLIWAFISVASLLVIMQTVT